MSLPPIIGHRGAAHHAPENTLAGLRLAARLGVRAVEIDTRLDGNGALIVLHDPTLDRTTDGTGRAALLPTGAIRRCDAGAWFAPSFAGEKVPLLDELLDLALRLRLAVNIELKADDERLGRATGRAVDRALRRRRRRPPLLLSSFSRPALAACGAWSRALIVGDGCPSDWIARACRLRAIALHVRHDRIGRALAARVHASGLRLGAYTVNRPALARRLFAAGVDYVFSDAPGRIRPR